MMGISKPTLYGYVRRYGLPEGNTYVHNQS